MGQMTEGDMTPMIDMTFQLIAFFMVLINFEQSQQVEEITLPSSAIIRPPKEVIDLPIFLHVTDDGRVYKGGTAYPLDQMAFWMDDEARRIKAEGKATSAAIVIIRADTMTKTGYVQELMKTCQDKGFTTFRLRVKEEERT